MIEVIGEGGEELARQFQHGDEAGGTVRGNHRERPRGEFHGDVVVGDIGEEGGGVEKWSNVVKPDQEHGVLESDVKMAGKGRKKGAKFLWGFNYFLKFE